MNPYIEGSWDVKKASENTAISGSCNINDISLTDGLLIRRYLRSKYRLDEILEQLEKLDDGEFDEAMLALLHEAKTKYLDAFKDAMGYNSPPPPPEPPAPRIIKEDFDFIEKVTKFFKNLIFKDK